MLESFSEHSEFRVTCESRSKYLHKRNFDHSSALGNSHVQHLCIAERKKKKVYDARRHNGSLFSRRDCCSEAAIVKKDSRGVDPFATLPIPRS